MSDINHKLLWAVKTGDLEEVKKLVSSGTDPNMKVEGRGLLHHAADFGQKQIMEYLIDMKVKIDENDDYGVSALLTAIYEGHVGCVELLIHKGASVNGKTPDGQSYLSACQSDDIKAVLQRAGCSC